MTDEQGRKALRSDEVLARQVGESRNQIARIYTPYQSDTQNTEYGG